MGLVLPACLMSVMLRSDRRMVAQEQKNKMYLVPAVVVMIAINIIIHRKGTHMEEPCGQHASHTGICKLSTAVDPVQSLEMIPSHRF